MEMLDIVLVFIGGLGAGWAGSTALQFVFDKKVGQAVGMALLGLFNAHFVIYPFL
ncbi:hypothetical protein BRE01_67260 [Brevibacillus reuszeri]|uniref:Permease n=1 Tax=Brevibacillus reuszeri TaxID=54915 RepID=A0ABQ0TZ17_9BACL|nr:hypothetical protein [Brevibacillus reuszeri]GED73024.1 hypothetical protein BRE01_67260 [Brevibacillus reuszeri]